jgi:transposase-like protein
VTAASPPAAVVSYKRHRFPAEIISHCVWLYHRFGLCLRTAEALGEHLQHLLMVASSECWKRGGA